MMRLEEVPEGDPFAVSATLFTTYRRCPQQALARLQGIYGEPSRASFKGALTHRIIARHISDGPIGEDDFALTCRQETGANLNAQLAAIGLKPSEFSIVVSEVEELYRRFQSVPLEGLEASEMSFEDEVTEGIVLRGRIDAVFVDEGRIRIVDWKTGSELSDETAAQLGFYALAWEKRTGTAPVRTEAVSLLTGERLIAEPAKDTLRDLEDEIARMIMQLREAMASGDELDRTAGPYCRWCPLLEECGEGAAAVEILD